MDPKIRSSQFFLMPEGAHLSSFCLIMPVIGIPAAFTDGMSGATARDFPFVIPRMASAAWNTCKRHIFVVLISLLGCAVLGMDDMIHSKLKVLHVS